MIASIDGRLTALVLKIPASIKPNHITGTRILLIPLVWALYYNVSPWAAASMFALLALTDFVDGRLARGRGLVSDKGKLLDIGSDLALVWSAVALLWTEDIIHLKQDPVLLWLLVFMFVREILITTIRLLFRVKADEVRVLKMGKCKTGFFMVGLCVLLTVTVWEDGGTLATVLLAIAAACSFLSGVQYVHQFTNKAQSPRESR